MAKQILFLTLLLLAWMPGAALAAAGPEAAAKPDAVATSDAQATPDAAASSADIERFIRYQPVPDIPAVAALGKSDLKPVRPGSVKDLAANLGSLYANGSLSPGVAVEVNPYPLFHRQPRTIEETDADFRRYTDNALYRAFVRSSFSVATDGSASATTSKIALGYRVRLVDDTDWRLNREGLQKATELLKLWGRAPSTDGTAQPARRLSKEDMKRIHDLLDGIFKPNLAWNAEQSALGISGSLFTSTGKVADLQDDSLDLWYSQAWPVLDWPLQLLVSPRYSHHEPTPATATAAANPLRMDTAGIGLGLISRPTDEHLRFKLDAGLGYALQDFPVASLYSARRAWSLGASTEFLAFDKQWVEVGFGTNGDPYNPTISGFANWKFGQQASPQAPATNGP